MEFKKIQTILFFVLFFAIGFLFFRMIYPYVFALFWAAVIATLFYPLYKKLVKRTGRENLSAILTIGIVIIVVLLPLVGVITLVIKQAFDTYTQINNPETLNNIQQILENIAQHPWVQRILSEVDIQQRLRSLSSTIASSGFTWLKIGSQNTLAFIINLFIMLYSLYYFLKEGPHWLQQLMYVLPFGDKNEALLYNKFASTAKATLKGTILIGGIQGAIGGLFFFIVGLPSPVFWALVMIIFSIIPAAGAGIVLVPASIYLLVTGQIWQAIVLLGGLVLAGTVDNLLRPPLVGKDIEMHPMMILFSTIGGLAMFGISGVVIGPMIATLFAAVLEMYEVKYKKQLDSSQT